MYAASAWRGLTTASDRQRINSVIDRARRQGYCTLDLPSFDELCIGVARIFGWGALSGAARRTQETHLRLPFFAKCEWLNA
jgi:hypothetical protein